MVCMKSPLLAERLGLLLWFTVSLVSFAASDEPARTSPNDDKPVPADHAERAKRGLALFKEHVREILTSHCLRCHGGDSIKADFSLSTRAELMASGHVGETADESNLIDLVRHTSEPYMPAQAEKLSDESIEWLRKWIDLGAPYDQPLAEGKHAAAGALVVSEEDRKHWAFQPLRSVPIPAVENDPWCRTPIDRFVLAAQEAEGLSPNQIADARTLVRRGALDALGLPATSEDVASLASSTNSAAWESYVDGLLNSPHFGERWARHWMDVARFAESHGYEQDYDRPNAYHYRDFLIHAFNEDMPFNQFVTWQLAGDETAPDQSLALMATGFLGAGAFPTQLTEAEFESARYDELDDMVTTTGVAFLGLSVGCARCHDHKYDPIPSDDYYRMAATFTTAIRSEIELDLHAQENAERLAAWKAELAALENRLRDYENQQVPPQFAQWLANYNPAESQDPWQGFDVIEVRSTGGSSFQRQPDGSWLAVGAVPDNEVITVIADSNLARPSKLRLEALTHHSLPQQGPGRAPNGNFALGDIQVSVTPVGVDDAGDRDDATRPVTIKRATATHQQNQDSLSVMASIDGDPVSGWAVDQGGIGHDQAAVFEFSDPVEIQGQARWTIQLTFNHPNTKHAVGRLRLSLSNREQAPTAVGGESLAAKITTSIAEAQSNGDPDSDAWRTAQSWFATTLPQWQERQQAIREHRERGPEPQLTTVMVTSEGLPHLKHHADDRGFPHFYPETYFLTRGDVHQKQGVARTGFLQVLMPEDLDEGHWKINPPAEAQGKSFRRASFANWMTDVDSGAGALVARVIVNRVWQHHFGRGLVATPNDFGLSGDRPSHPDLLDWLAADLVEHGWKLKRLHRLIMTSSVYMQSSAHDEARAGIDRENRLLWRWTPRRLEAEAIRDSMLSVSGSLDPTMYGPGTLDLNMSRRSVYFFIKRSQLIPMMMLFDWPEHLVSIGQRSRTTIAPQALMFLNSPQGRRFADSLARKLATDSPAEAVTGGYKLAFAREPTTAEAALSEAFLEQQTAMYRDQDHPDAAHAARVDFCQMLISMNEFVFIE